MLVWYLLASFSTCVKFKRKPGVSEVPWLPKKDTLNRTNTELELERREVVK